MSVGKYVAYSDPAGSCTRLRAFLPSGRRWDRGPRQGEPGLGAGGLRIGAGGERAGKGRIGLRGVIANGVFHWGALPGVPAEKDGRGGSQ